MSQTRTKRWVWMPACCALALVSLACGGPALLAHNGALPAFDADISIWPGTTLTIHSTPARACGTAAHCPYQIKIQPALSIWLIYQVRRRGNVDTLGRRLLYIPVTEPVIR
jgi:hypothetical protein